MNDILALITEYEGPIVDRWCSRIRAQPGSPYARLGDNDLKTAVRLSARLLLHVMQTGNTAAMEKALRANARRRAADDFSYPDTVAVWMIYRQIIHDVLFDDLNAPDDWEQFVDRIDTVLSWVLEIVSSEYDEAEGAT